MSEQLDQQVQHALAELDASCPPHDLPSDAQVWSRLQFRLAYRPRRANVAGHAGALLVSVYVLVLLVWVTRSASLFVSLVGVLAFAAAAAVVLCLRINRTFRS